MDPAVLPVGLVSRPLKRIAVRVLCDPYIYVHRNGYWCGVFFEEEVESYLLRELHAGDTVIDVGANVGHVALPAAALVGPSGMVLAFEPNPELAGLVEAAAAAQHLPLRMHPMALGDTAGVFSLRMDPAHTGGATLRSTTDPAMHVSVPCPVRIGDDVIGALGGRVLLKIDVEGFELSVLRGLKNTLQRVDHAILEVSPEWLGSSGVETLFSLMAEAGLSGHRLGVDGSVGPRVAPADIDAQVNIVFRREH